MSAVPDNPTSENLKPVLAKLMRSNRVPFLLTGVETAHGRVYTKDAIRDALALFEAREQPCLPIYNFSKGERWLVGSAYALELEPSGHVTAKVVLSQPYWELFKKGVLEFTSIATGRINLNGVLDNINFNGLRADLVPDSVERSYGHGGEDPVDSLDGRGA